MMLAAPMFVLDFCVDFQVDTSVSVEHAAFFRSEFELFEYSVQIVHCLLNVRRSLWDRTDIAMRQ
jgi:hypothetical protein